MPYLSPVVKGALLDYHLGGPIVAPYPVLYFALLTTASDSSGAGWSELRGNGYTRVAVSNNFSFWSDPNQTHVVFPIALADWQTVYSWAVFDAASGGNLLMAGDFSSGGQSPASIAIRKFGILKWKFHSMSVALNAAISGGSLYINRFFGASNRFDKLFFSLMRTPTVVDTFSSPVPITSGNGGTYAGTCTGVVLNNTINTITNVTAFAPFSNGRKVNSIPVKWGSTYWPTIVGPPPKPSPFGNTTTQDITKYSPFYLPATLRKAPALFKIYGINKPTFTSLLTTPQVVSGSIADPDWQLPVISSGSVDCQLFNQTVTFNPGSLVIRA